MGKGAIAVAELEERSRETAMGVDIVVLLDELAVGELGLLRPAAHEERGCRVARETVIRALARRGPLAELLFDLVRELGGALGVHEPARDHTRALRERTHLRRLDGICVGIGPYGVLEHRRHKGAAKPHRQHFHPLLIDSLRSRH